MEMTKKEYASELRKYLMHKRQLARVTDYYKMGLRAVSMARVWDLYVMVKADCDGYGMEKLKEMVRVNEVHLRNILPIKGNSSYEGQVKKLEELLIIAKSK